MEKNDHIQGAIRLAQDASLAASPDLRQKAFEVVLSHLLNEDQASARPIREIKHKEVNLTSENAPVLNIERIATQLGITEEQAAELYQMTHNDLHLGIRPVGERLSDRQRNLAHALVVGYRLGLDIKEVSITAINDAAEEWNVRDANISRSLKESTILQMKGGGKGKKPVFSLSPNSIERAAAEIITMFS